MPKGKTVIQATLDPADINQSVPVAQALVGDAQLTLAMLVDACRERLGGTARDAGAVTAEIRDIEADWLAQMAAQADVRCRAALAVPGAVGTFQHTVDVANTIITHDAGSPRDQLSPFLEDAAATHLSRLGASRPQLGYGLGLAMGAKLACPDKLCINVWGDCRDRFHWHGLRDRRARASADPVDPAQQREHGDGADVDCPVATEKYRSTDISGNYAKLSEALGGYGERVTSGRRHRAGDPPWDRRDRARPPGG